MWTVAECAIGIVCVSLPSLRPLLSRCFPAAFRSQYHSHRSGGASASHVHSAKQRLGAGSLSAFGDDGDDFAPRGGATAGLPQPPPPIELVRTRRASWVMLPDPEAQLDEVWDREERVGKT
jgi:hypothetical protein